MVLNIPIENNPKLLHSKHKKSTCLEAKIYYSLSDRLIATRKQILSVIKALITYINLMVIINNSIVWCVLYRFTILMYEFVCMIALIM